MTTSTVRRAFLMGAGLACFGARADQDIKIRFAHSLSTAEPGHQAAVFFAKNVTERSHGRVQVTVYPAEQLGPAKDINEMIRQGANVMNMTDPGYMSDFVPDVGVLNGPPDSRHASATPGMAHLLS